MNANHYLEKLKFADIQQPKILILYFVVPGMLLRLIPYLFNRSLWYDEAALSLNIVNKGFMELTQPLDYYQTAPIGFLWIERFFTQVLGNNEFALRLFPLLAGMASVYLFYLLVRKILSGEAMAMGLLLFVVSNTSVYFASEVKQYSSDVMIATGLLLLAVNEKSYEPRIRNFLILSFTGICAIFVSHPAVFVLAGIGTVLIISALVRKEYKAVLFIMLVGFSWLLFFGFIYLTVYQYQQNNSGLMTFWSGAFMPFPPKSVEDLKWFFITYFSIFKNPMGFTLGSLAGFVFAAGIMNFWVNSREKLFLLMLPLFYALLASGMGKYPFAERLTLFLLPVIVLVIASGIQFLASANQMHKIKIYGLFVIFLIIPLLIKTVIYEVTPKRFEVKDVLLEMQKYYQPGDQVLMNEWIEKPYLYYHKKFRLPGKYTLYKNLSSDLINNGKVSGSPGKRIWVLYSWWEQDNKSIKVIGNEANRASLIKKISAYNSEGYLLEYKKE